MKISANIVTALLSRSKTQQQAKYCWSRFLDVIGSTKYALGQPPLDKRADWAKFAATPFLTTHLSCSAEAFV
jgi:hypothetical protein